MRRGIGLVFAILSLIAFSMPAFADQAMLQADIDNGIVVWTGNKVIYKNNQPTWDNLLRIYVGPDDVQRLKQWGSGYVVIRVMAVDPYFARSPLIRIHIYSGEPSAGNELYVGDWVDVPGPGTVEIPIPSWVIQNLPNDGIRIVIELFGGWDTVNQSDHRYAIRVTQVILAPPSGSSAEQNEQQEQGQASTSTVNAEQMSVELARLVSNLNALQSRQQTAIIAVAVVAFIALAIAALSLLRR